MLTNTKYTHLNINPCHAAYFWVRMSDIKLSFFAFQPCITDDKCPLALPTCLKAKIWLLLKFLWRLQKAKGEIQIVPTDPSCISTLKGDLEQWQKLDLTIKGHGSCTITHLDIGLGKRIQWDWYARVAVIVCTWLHQHGVYPPTPAQDEAHRLWRALQSPPKATKRPPLTHHCGIHLCGTLLDLPM